MIRVSAIDFEKFVRLVAKEGMQGATLSFRDDGTSLKVGLTDRNGKELIVELADTDYPFMPRVTRTETI